MNITLEKALEDYGEIKLYFSSYYKYEFTFSSKGSGFIMMVTVGGDSSDIYRFSVDAYQPLGLKTLNNILDINYIIVRKDFDLIEKDYKITQEYVG